MPAIGKKAVTIFCIIIVIFFMGYFWLFKTPHGRSWQYNKSTEHEFHAWTLLVLNSSKKSYHSDFSAQSAVAKARIKLANDIMNEGIGDLRSLMGKGSPGQQFTNLINLSYAESAWGRAKEAKIHAQEALDLMNKTNLQQELGEPDKVLLEKYIYNLEKEIEVPAELKFEK